MSVSKKRLDTHGKEIDELKERTAKVETDLKAVKQRITDLHGH
jgi:peptidoglycan hydrolase CwlO-like protein